MGVALMEGLTERLLAGDKLACARLISFAENETPGYKDLLKAVYPYAGNAYVIGITGPPGSGKSTLTDKLAKYLLDDGYKVGIVAIDPTSPFTKGAILGDRIRMSGVSNNKNAFIRSMGTRGNLGGLSRATSDALAALSAYGCDYIFVETVGVGQSEIDIVKTADTVLMVLAPGLGDDIQAIKAGVMEIGDVFVINKADREGADRAYREVMAMLDFKTDWDFRPPVHMTTAETGEGVKELLDGLLKHRDYLILSGKLAVSRSKKKAERVRGIVKGELDKRLDGLLSASFFGDGNNLDPYAIAEEILVNIRI